MMVADEDPVAPNTALGSPSLRSDVGALWEILNPKVVPKVSIRAKKIVSAVFGFGDASGTGLGAT